MASEEMRYKSVTDKLVWPLLFITAALHIYLGLSSVAYVFMGVANPASGPGAWMAAVAGGLQAIAAAAAFALAARRDLRGATFAVASCMMLDWLSMLPAAVAQGLDFRGEDAVSAFHFVLAPVFAIVAAMLARRNAHPVAAALVATAPTAIGIVVVAAFAVVIAVYGF